MLVLSRHTNEKVVITLKDAEGNKLESLEVVVVAIRGDKVRLGFDAPANFEIHRKEVQEAIDRDGYNKFNNT